MVESEANTVYVNRLSALAQPHRLAVFRLLVEAGPAGLAAGDIAGRLALPASSLSFHLAHLHRAGLVAQRRAGRSLIYTADFAAMNNLVAYLTENCCGGIACAPSERFPECQ
jgi:ArsR family transcriptional regulator, arsenate/arsenite/antimonite-responsive transcriptional repressor